MKLLKTSVVATILAINAISVSATFADSSLDALFSDTGTTTTVATSSGVGSGTVVAPVPTPAPVNAEALSIVSQTKNGSVETVSLKGWNKEYLIEVSSGEVPFNKANFTVKSGGNAVANYTISSKVKDLKEGDSLNGVTYLTVQDTVAELEISASGSELVRVIKYTNRDTGAIEELAKFSFSVANPIDDLLAPTPVPTPVVEPIPAPTPTPVPTVINPNVGSEVKNTGIEDYPALMFMLFGVLLFGYFGAKRKGLV